MTKRRYDPEATRQDIMDAAEQLFAERGFGGVSTSAIAKAAGVSQSQIHYHFETKRKLWEQVFARRFDQYHAVQIKLLERDDLQGTERLAESIREYFRFFTENPVIVTLMVRAQLEDEEMRSENSEVLLTRGAAVVAEAQRQGHLRDDVAPEFVVMGFLSLVAQWFQSRGRLMPSDSSLCRETGRPGALDAAYLDFILKVYLQGMAPAAGAAA